MEDSKVSGASAWGNIPKASLMQALVIGGHVKEGRKMRTVRVHRKMETCIGAYGSPAAKKFLQTYGLEPKRQAPTAEQLAQADFSDDSATTVSSGVERAEHREIIYPRGQPEARRESQGSSSASQPTPSTSSVGQQQQQAPVVFQLDAATLTEIIRQVQSSAAPVAARPTEFPRVNRGGSPAF